MKHSHHMQRHCVWRVQLNDDGNLTNHFMSHDCFRLVWLNICTHIAMTSMVAVRMPCPSGRMLHLVLVLGDEPRAFGCLRG